MNPANLVYRLSTIFGRSASLPITRAINGSTSLPTSISKHCAPLLQGTRSTIFARMATTGTSNAPTTASTKEWLIILPDQADALQRRLEIRQKHLHTANDLQRRGIFLMGGATLEKHVEPGQTPAFTGSVLLVAADTKEEVERMLKDDVYTKNEVWDWEKVQILPVGVPYVTYPCEIRGSGWYTNNVCIQFKTALRSPMSST